MSKKQASMGAIFLTVFLDMLSFGLVIPDIQDRADQIDPRGWMIGLVIASFSIAQFFCAPYLGRLSDSLGRRKILLITAALTAVGHFIYAYSDSLWIIFASRIIGGIASANLAVAYAYVADITKPEDRSKSMGMLGAAFGLGFLVGPVTGAKLLKLGNDDPLLLGYVAASFAVINFIYILIVVRESIKSESEKTVTSAANLKNMVRAFKTPYLAIFLALFAAANFAFANLETTYFRLVLRQFQLTKEDGAYLLAIVGIVGVIVQGLLIKKVVSRFGEIKVLRVCYFVQVPCLAVVPFAPPWFWQILGIIVLGTVSGMVQPSINGMISKVTPSDMQGGIFGVTQSIGSLARMIAPIVSNSLYDVRYWLPYAYAALLMAIPAVLIWFVKLPKISEEAEKNSEEPVPAS